MGSAYFSSYFAKPFYIISRAEHGKHIFHHIWLNHFISFPGQSVVSIFFIIFGQTILYHFQGRAGSAYFSSYLAKPFYIISRAEGGQHIFHHIWLNHFISFPGQSGVSIFFIIFG